MNTTLMILLWWLTGLIGCLTFRFLDNLYWAQMGIPRGQSKGATVGTLFCYFIVSCAGGFVWVANIVCIVTLIIASKFIQGIWQRKLW